MYNTIKKEENKLGEFAKYDSKFDFDCKSIPKLKSDAKVTENPCEITVILVTKQKKQNSFLRIYPR